MKNYIILSFLFLITLVNISAQSNKHQIVFQMVTSDTLAHKAFMKQLGNIHSVSPESSIKVVVHGPGLDMISIKKSIVTKSIQNAIEHGVVFEVCEFSMKERKVEKSEVLPFVQYTPAGIIRIVELQDQGFKYIKSGF